MILSNEAGSISTVIGSGQLGSNSIKYSTIGQSVPSVSNIGVPFKPDNIMDVSALVNPPMYKLASITDNFSEPVQEQTKEIVNFSGACYDLYSNAISTRASWLRS